jgi:WhiB family transcriptional regulator, redox-sensing transcriptional regulator
MINQHSMDAIPQEWMKLGVCTDPTIDPDWFFPDTEHNNDQEVKLALNMCRQCPVRINCLQYAIDSWPVYGIWGGLRTKQIKEIVNRMEISK